MSVRTDRPSTAPAIHDRPGTPAALPRRQAFGRMLTGVGALAPVAALAAACSPTVRVEAPDRPIEINLNIRIDQEVRIRLDRELDSLFEGNPDIF